MTEVQRLEDRYQLATYRKFPITAELGRGVWLITASGDRYLDLYGGHAVAVTGHCHPRVVEAIHRQSNNLLFYSNLVYNSARASAAQALARIAPPGLDRVFFVNSGTEAIENGIRLARMATGKPEILSFKGGFHGRTLAAISATGLGSYRDRIGPRAPHHTLLPFNDLEALEAAFEFPVAAVLLEPIQSMAGVRSFSSQFLKRVRQLCSECGALLIFDEVQTGMGRTGDWFFAPRHDVSPDLICLAKAMASGVPMGALLVDSALAAGVRVGDLGSTFGGGPLACAALSATIEVIEAENLLKKVRVLRGYLDAGLASLDWVRSVRGEGFLIGIEVEGRAAALQQYLLNHRVLAGLSSDPHVLRLLPPLTLQTGHLERFLEVLGRWRPGEPEKARSSGRQ